MPRAVDTSCLPFFFFFFFNVLVYSADVGHTYVTLYESLVGVAGFWVMGEWVGQNVGMLTPARYGIGRKQ